MLLLLLLLLVRVDVVAGAYHRQLALESARQSIVLLQNPVFAPRRSVGRGRTVGHILPLKASRQLKVFVGGPSSNLSDALLGQYRPVPCADGTANCVQTVLQVRTCHVLALQRSVL